jgi:hypothetical protein
MDISRKVHSATKLFTIGAELAKRDEVKRESKRRTPEIGFL